MRMEYIFIKPNDDYCTTVEGFLNFLCSNRRIKCEKNRLLFDLHCIDYKLELVNTENLEEIMFHLDVEVKESEEEVDVLEEFDAILKHINEHQGMLFIINTIWDEISTYYGEKLYSRISNVEKMLRKIIYLFMLKTVGSKWLSSSTPPKFQESINNVIEKNNKKKAEVNAEQLNYADFITLSSFFTVEYSLKRDVRGLFAELEGLKDGESLSQEWMEKLFRDYKPENNWNRYFSKSLNVEKPKRFFDDWRSLYDIRNKVAHGKLIRKREYQKAIKLTGMFEKAFKDCISIIDTLKMSPEEAKAVETVAQEVISKEKEDNNIDKYLKYIIGYRTSNGLIDYLVTDEIMKEYTGRTEERIQRYADLLKGIKEATSKISQNDEETEEVN